MILAFSWLYGVDYDTSSYGSNSLFSNKELNNRNVPCAVCEAGARSTQVNQPSSLSGTRF